MKTPFKINVFKNLWLDLSIDIYTDEQRKLQKSKSIEYTNTEQLIKLLKGKKESLINYDPFTMSQDEILKETVKRVKNNLIDEVIEEIR